MEERDEVIDGRKRRKKSPRPVRSEKASAAMRRRWQDPEQRELMRQRDIRREALRKERPWSRFGIFDGVGGREGSDAIWARARAKAERTITILKDKNVIDKNMDPRAEKALTGAIEVLDTPSNQQLKLAAARLVLDFTMAKPAQKQDITVKTAEDWLAQVTEDADTPNAE